MGPAAILNILVTANTGKATANLRKTEAQAARTHKGFGRLGSGSNTLEKHLSNLAKGALAAGAALVSIHEAKSAIETTEGLAKSTIELQRNFGLTAKEASTWGSVLKANNVDINSAKMSFTSLSKAIVGAGNDSKPAVAAFKQLGISQQDLKGQNFDQVLNEVTKSLTNMKGGTERAQAAQALLGRGAKLLAPLFRGDGLGFQQQAKWAREYGATLDGHAIKNSKELMIASEKLKYAQLGLQIAFTEKVAPALMKVGTAISTFVNQMRTGEGAGGKFANVLRTLGNALSSTVEFFKRNHAALTALKAAILASIAAWVAMGVAVTISTGGLNLIIPAVAALAAGLTYAYQKSEKFRDVVRAVFNTVLKIIQTYVALILTVLDKFLGGIQLLMDAASHLPFVGKKFKGIADAIGGAREKVRELRDAVQNIQGLKADVKVNVTANLVDVQQHTGTMKALGNRRAMGGLVVGGSGSGDKVPLQAMVEPGEQLFVLNRNASAALDFLQGVNAAVPRFAGGGSLKLGPGVGGRLRDHLGMVAGRAEGKWLQSHRGQFVTSGVGGAGAAAGVRGVGGSFAKNRELARKMVTAAFGASQFAPFDILEMHEAGYNPFARNSSSGAFGIPQALPPTKMPLAAQRGDVRSQLLWMISYIRGRYGTPANAWAQYYAHPGGVGYYAKGGPVAVSGKPQGIFSRQKQDPIKGLELMRSIWNVARNYYPGGAGHGMPHTLSIHGFPLVGDIQNPGTRRGQFINWPSWMDKWLTGNDPGRRSAAMQTLIHEWAHYFQKPNLPMWQAEGGAQAWAREFGPQIFGKLGMPYSNQGPRDDSYIGYVRRVRGQLGEQWIRKGQFAKLQRGGIARLRKGGVGRLTHHATPFSHHYVSPVTGHGFGAGRHVLNWKKTHGKAGAPGKALDLFQSVQDQLDTIDLMVQAGDIDQATGTAREIAQITYALGHAKQYGLTGPEQLQLRATRHGLETGASGEDPNQPLIDALQAQAEAEQALTDQLKGVQDEMKRNNDINEGTLAITAREATRAMTDVLAGQLGYRVSTAGFSPGFGVGARY